MGLVFNFIWDREELAPLNKLEWTVRRPLHESCLLSLLAICIPNTSRSPSAQGKSGLWFMSWTLVRNPRRLHWRGDTNDISRPGPTATVQSWSRGLHCCPRSLEAEIENGESHHCSHCCKTTGTDGCYCLTNGSPQLGLKMHSMRPRLSEESLRMNALGKGC